MSALSEILESARRTQKRVLVVGLGITAVESARFLRQRGIKVGIVEKVTEEKFRSLSRYSSEVDDLKDEGVEIHFGVDGERIAPHLIEAALVVVSPGVPLESTIIGSIRRHKIPFVSELELGVQLHQGPVVVLTGSNGKSTTATLIDCMLRQGGLSTRLCGSVGSPVLTSESLLGASQSGESILVVEASSYQLEACTVLKPDVTVVLNISDNHLERHGSLERYAATQARAIRLQSQDDLSVMNGDDTLVRDLSRSCRAQLGLFGTASESELNGLSSRWARVAGSDTSGNPIVVSLGGVREEYRTDGARLLGRHNRYNMAAAILVARRFGVEPRFVQEVIHNFEPLEHRLEVVWSDGHRVIINDSKSTTVAASVAGMSTVFFHFPSLPVTLLIGGLSKAGSWRPLLRMIREHRGPPVSVVCFGNDRSLVANHCKDVGIDPVVYPTLREATRHALAALTEGGVVLLSPGCASFDEFIDFEHRGAEFKRYVHEDIVHQAGASGVL